VLAWFYVTSVLNLLFLRYSYSGAFFPGARVGQC